MEQIILALAVTLIPLILAICVHEFAHVAMARWLGDDTGTRMGRFTLNPLAHIDPIWTLLVPAVLVVGSAGGNTLPFFGAGKPAPYVAVRLDRRIRGKRISMRTGELLVAAAGPFSNLLLAIASMLILAVVVRLGVEIHPYSPLELLFRFAQLNLALMVFNLIPIPPLDGSKVLMSLLPRGAAAKYEEISSGLSWVLLAVVILGGGLFIRPLVAWLSGILSLLL